MSLRRGAAGPLQIGLIGWLLAPVGVAQSPTASSELIRCTHIAAAAERLACYDAHVCALIAAAAERLACYDALAPPATAPVVPSAAPQAEGALHASPTAPAPLPNKGPSDKAAPDAQTFGLTPHRAPAPSGGVESVTALVVQVSEDRQGNLTVSLDNSQIWTVTELGAALRPGDSVTIKRAAFGSFLMRTPARRSYHARRIQ